MTIREFLTVLANEIHKKLNRKVDKVSGKQLSTNDYDNSSKAKLDAIETITNQEIDDLFTPESGESGE